MLKPKNTKVSLTAIFMAVAMLFAGLTLTGCAPQAGEKPPAEVDQSEQNQQPTDTQKGSEIITTTLNLVDQGKTLSLDFSLKNSSDEELQLSHGSGHQYDIIVTDAQDREVYNWAADKAFTLALIYKDLAPGQALSYSEEWDYTDNEGNPLPAGKYSVKVSIIVMIENEEIKDKVKAEDFTAVKEIEIR